MQESPNVLKANLISKQLQLGIWCSLAGACTTEVVAGAGCDWVLIDGEHSPNDLRTVMAQLQVLAAFATEPVVRLPSDDTNLIKQFVDAGARNLMIPNVRNAEQASRIVAATRYAPDGIRGFSVGHRANQFGRIKGYHEAAHRNQLLTLQIECAEGVRNAAEIAAVDGVDALFVGPGDLSTNLGAMHNPNAPHVQDAIASVHEAATEQGKSAGTLASVKVDADRYIADGFRVVAVGSDLGILARGADALMSSFGKAQA